MNFLVYDFIQESRCATGCFSEKEWGGEGRLATMCVRKCLCAYVRERVCVYVRVYVCVLIYVCRSSLPQNTKRVEYFYNNFILDVSILFKIL